MSQADRPDDASAHLLGQFRLLGVTPKGESPEQIQDWMVDYLKQIGKLPDLSPKVETDVQTHNPTTIHVTTRVPNITVFSGNTTAKNENFDTWKYEVNCLQLGDQYPLKVVAEAVRRSLKGEAANVVKRLGITVSIPDIVQKLEGVFGNVVLTENVLAEFYSTHQRPEEDVAKWSCRLEDILEQANTQKQISIAEQNEMLRNKLYSGLNDPLKARCGHLFYNIKDYDELRINFRRVEQELKPNNLVYKVPISGNKPTKAVTQSVVSNTSKKVDINDVQDKMAVLQEQNDSLQKQLNDIQLSHQNCCSAVPKGRSEINHSRGHDRGQGQTNRLEAYHSNVSPTGYSGRGANTNFSPHVQANSGYTQYNPRYNNHILNPQSQPWLPSNMSQHRYQTSTPQCWRCGQFGHRQYRCTVILNKPLN